MCVMANAIKRIIRNVCSGGAYPV